LDCSKVARHSIVLLGFGFVNWGGGVDFLRYCANALATACDRTNIKIIILLPDLENSSFIGKIRAYLSPYKRIVKALLAGQKPVFVRQKPFSRQQLANMFQGIAGNVDIIFYSQGENLTAVLSKFKNCVIIPTFIPLEPDVQVPWVGYLYDFQHKYYPDFFSNEEIIRRDYEFSQMLTKARAVIVNASEVKKDIKKFYPQAKCRVFNLPFSAAPIESWFEPASANFMQKYMLPQKYFVMCNQFWIHKGHLTAFTAFAKYVQVTRNDDVHLVCTGNTFDARKPNYFSELRNKVSQLGLVHKIHFLGHIPKKDQIDILKGSIAVLQPTLFEGGPGGGAVYDAIAMGVPAIVSDIPVNKELDGVEGLLFFKTEDVDDMTEKMIEVQNLIPIEQNKEKLLLAGRERTRRLGLRLLEAIEYVSREN